jgi:geranylgeranyl reductase
MDETQKDYDVLIIGAGPAGLSCALELSRSQLRVLVLEQKEIIGPKVCAGGLTRKDLQHIAPPPELLHDFCEIDIRTPYLDVTGKDASPMISTVDRRRFAEWQLERLSAAPNVEIRTGCKVTEIRKDGVTVNGIQRLGCRYLVGADGSFSPVRHHLGLKSERIAVAIQYILPTDRYDRLEFFLDSRLFKAWYAWIFPHKDYASIGCMGDARHLPAKDLQRNFKVWLERQGIDVSAGRYEGYAINYDYRGYRFGSIFLCGDAAGLASGLTGEGIYQAVVSGEEVARTILDPDYTAPKISALLETKRLHDQALAAALRLGPLRNLFFALLALLARNRKLAYRLSRYVS